MALKHFVVVNLSDEIVEFINAPSTASAIRILKMGYPENYEYYDMYQIEKVFDSYERIEGRKHVLSETEDW